MGQESLVSQVKRVFHGIFVPGRSRRELKELGRAHEYIVGIGTFEEYLRIGCRAAKWCKEHYGIRRLADITSEMMFGYIGSLAGGEPSGGYLSKVLSALRKLDYATKFMGWRSFAASEWLPEGLGHHSDPRPERSYQPDAAQRLFAELDHAREPQIVLVARLQYALGLRIAEAVLLRGQDIDLVAGKVNVVRGTKGGRPRVVPIAPGDEEFLAALQARAAEHSDGCIFQGRGRRGKSLGDRARAAITAAAKRAGIEDWATHGFRRGYAQLRFAEILDAGASVPEAETTVSEELGHHRREVLAAYVPRPE